MGTDGPKRAEGVRRGIDLSRMGGAKAVTSATTVHGLVLRWVCRLIASIEIAFRASFEVH